MEELVFPRYSLIHIKRMFSLVLNVFDLFWLLVLENLKKMTRINSEAGIRSTDVFGFFFALIYFCCEVVTKVTTEIANLLKVELAVFSRKFNFSRAPRQKKCLLKLI